MWSSIVKKEKKNNIKKNIKNVNIKNIKKNIKNETYNGNMSSEEIFEMKYNMLLFDYMFDIVDNLKYKIDILNNNITSNDILDFMENYICKDDYDELDNDSDYESDEF